MQVGQHKPQCKAHFCAEQHKQLCFQQGQACLLYTSLRRRAEAQEKYFVYLTAELAPRILTLNKAEKGTKIWCAGVDLGA